MIRRKESWRKRNSRDGVESLEDRRLLAADGIALGPFLEGIPELHDQVDTIAAAIASDLDSARELTLGEFSYSDDFDAADDIDVFKVTTPPLSADATGNGFLQIGTDAFSTVGSSLVVVADSEGVATDASLSLLPGLGFSQIQVEPETTYYFGVAQVTELDAWGVSTDVVGPYQINLAYFEPLPVPPEPADVEPDQIEAAQEVVGPLATGFLNSEGDTDYFSFTTTQAGVLRVVMDLPPMNIAELRLEDADGATLASEPSLFVPTELALDVEANETYFVSVRGESGGGAYNLLFLEESITVPEPPQDVHGDTAETATDIAATGGFSGFATMFGVINDVDDVDWFRRGASTESDVWLMFSPNEAVVAELVTPDGEVFHTFTMDEPEYQVTGQGEFFVRVSSDANSAMVPYDFFVFDATLNPLGLDPDSGFGENPVDPVVIEEPDPVDNVPTEDLVGDTPDTARPLFELASLGLDGLYGDSEALNGWNDSGAPDVDYFSAPLDEGIYIAEVWATERFVDPSIQYSVIGPDGEIVAENIFGEAVDFVAPVTGEYFVQVTSAEATRVNYNVMFSVHPPVGQPEVSDPDPGSTDPEEWTAEEWAEILGIDLDGVMNPESDPSTPSTPEVMSWEELAILLGLDPEVATDPDTIDPNALDQAIEELTDGAPDDRSPIAAVRMGDVDMNDSVNFDDFLIMSKYFGTTEGAEWQHGNFDGDGDVDFADFLALSAEFDS